MLVQCLWHWTSIKPPLAQHLMFAAWSEMLSEYIHAHIDLKTLIHILKLNYHSDIICVLSLFTRNATDWIYSISSDDILNIVGLQQLQQHSHDFGFCSICNWYKKVIWDVLMCIYINFWECTPNGVVYSLINWQWCYYNFINRTEMSMRLNGFVPENMPKTIKYAKNI